MWNQKIKSCICPFLSLLAFTVLLYSALAIKDAKSSPAKYSKKELNDLLEKVWKKSELDLENLRDYVFSETEIHAGGYRREYAWVVRDGYLLRSPVLINGEKVSAEEQKVYEDKWIKARQNAGKWKNNIDFLIDCAGDCLVDIYAPRGGVDAAWKGLEMGTAGLTPFQVWLPKHFSFLAVKPAKYDYGGELLFERRKVIAIKYISDSYFAGKASLNILVTLFISPEERQLVGISVRGKGNPVFEHLMIMDKPTGDIWLPKRYSIQFMDVTAKINPVPRYACVKEFHSYAKSDVKVKLWFD
jgi:hypothetical protein